MLVGCRAAQTYQRLCRSNHVVAGFSPRSLGGSPGTDTVFETRTLAKARVYTLDWTSAFSKQPTAKLQMTVPTHIKHRTSQRKFEFMITAFCLGLDAPSVRERSVREDRVSTSSRRRETLPTHPEFFAAPSNKSR